ncbi:MAG: flavodoxin [Pseudomonadota bacterium]
MKSMLVVYHSQSGSCASLARAAWSEARREEGVNVEVLRAWDAGLTALTRADGVLLIAAENSGSLSGTMKDFLDRTFYPAIDSGVVLPYASIISAGNDGRGALKQMQRILTGYPMPCAAEPLILRGEVNEQHLRSAGELGRAFAAGLVMGIF